MFWQNVWNDVKCSDKKRERCNVKSCMCAEPAIYKQFSLPIGQNDFVSPCNDTMYFSRFLSSKRHLGQSDKLVVDTAIMVYYYALTWMVHQRDSYTAPRGGWRARALSGRQTHSAGCHQYLLSSPRLTTHCAPVIKDCVDLNIRFIFNVIMSN